MNYNAGEAPLGFDFDENGIVTDVDESWGAFLRLAGNSTAASAPFRGNPGCSCVQLGKTWSQRRHGGENASREWRLRPSLARRHFLIGLEDAPLSPASACPSMGSAEGAHVHT